MEQATNSIISIKPTYAEAILSFRKTVELRRRIPATPVGSRLWIYATKPVAAVIGTAVVAKISRGTPRDIWNTYNDVCGVTESEFFDYYSDAREAVAIELRAVERCLPVTMQQLQEILDGFHPPQVMTRMSRDEVENLEAWIKAA